MGDYDKFADEYAMLTERLEGETRKHFYSLLPSSLEGKLLLDVGCGSGQDASYYAGIGAEVRGIDISKVEIEKAKKKGFGKFQVADMGMIPYESGKFDFVTSVYALQAAEDVAASVQEMIRVAKPGATILILAKHPTRNLLESHVNDGKSDYYTKRKVTSYIFQRSITLSEPGHTIMDYLHPEVLEQAKLELFEEHSDFPASEQVMPGLVYPTYMIMKFKKKE